MTYTLTAQKRENVSTKLEQLRGDKLVPAILYGFKVENQPLQVNSQEFKKIYQQAGENQIVDLTIDGDIKSVLIKEIQIHPVKRDFVHVDFQAVDVTQPVIVEVPLHFTGEAPAVKASGGSLLKKLRSIEIECLPKNLPKVVDVKLESLITLEDAFHVKDIILPEGVEVLSDRSDLVVTVVPPRVEKEPTVAEGEGVAEGEEAAEGGEAAPTGDAKAGVPAKDGKAEAKSEDKKE